MRIQVRTPFGQSLRGNGVTADRWIAILGALGHRVVPDEGDVLVALHARHSHGAIVAFKKAFPARPVILALTGTDVYRDIQFDADAQRSLQLADRYVVLQPHAVGELPPALRHRAHVIFQSAPPPVDPPPRATDAFQVCVVGHLRQVKDPFRIVEALREVPEDPPLRVVHLGAALEDDMRARAERETQASPRYRWLGERSHAETLGTIAASHLMVLTSVMEGGANVLTEALACGTPCVVSDMGAARGLLGSDYPGLFEIGDTAGLAALLGRAARDEAFYAVLSAACDARRPLTEPARERGSWAALLASLSPPPPG